MKYITSIISKLSPIKSDTKVLLGRWTIDYCKKTTNNKIDLANEDHCGSCNNYRLKKVTSENQRINYIKQNRIIDIE